MNKIIFMLLFASSVVATTFTGCKKADNLLIQNQPPVVNAGADQSIQLPMDSAQLMGSATSVGGTIVSYSWTKIFGPVSFIIINANAPIAVTKKLVIGFYGFELKVTDNNGISAKDTVQIAVNKTSVSILALKANAGPDQTISLPASTVILNGSGSDNVNNRIVSFEWTKISGPVSINIVSPNEIQTQVNNLVHGIYKFELKITDFDGLVSKDTVTVLVKSYQNHWLQLAYLPDQEFFFGSNSNWWFSGYNFLMGIDNNVFAVSHAGGIWRFDNSWSKAGIFPEKMDRAPIVFSINGKGYIIGNGHCWQYDPVTSIWTRKNDPPVSVVAITPFVINNKAYFQDLNSHMIAFDPSSDSYTQKNNYPDPTKLRPLFVINGEGYYLGDAGKCWKYDVANDSWDHIADFGQSESVYNISSFSTNKYGYIIGDLNLAAYNENMPMNLWRYDPSKKQWEQFEEDYPGNGVYSINTISLNGFAYIGLGYNNGDFNAIDFWKFME